MALFAMLVGLGLPARHGHPPAPWVMVRADAVDRAISSMQANGQADEEANDQVHAELSSYELEMLCMPPQVMIIAWTTALEENVAGYKVHRHSLDGQQAHAWVNSVPITARGPNDYRILDANALPNQRYLYRLYAFDATYQLSHAEQIILANPVQPTCLHLPITRHEG